MQKNLILTHINDYIKVARGSELLIGMYIGIVSIVGDFLSLHDVSAPSKEMIVCIQTCWFQNSG
jgi:hypothetical protein